jgi:hypothetical protein
MGNQNVLLVHRENMQPVHPILNVVIALVVHMRLIMVKVDVVHAVLVNIQILVLTPALIAQLENILLLVYLNV